ncbi:MAG: DUF763 domain-containing protein [Candidatus Peregrinibacteria bacterium]|nr:DUF763 domain-containing protein [Candidatus Peregrinibacteria bacterium]
MIEFYPMRRGIATFTLDTGKCPKWLYDRMVVLGREIIQILVAEYGPDEFIKRISDPVWFQSLGTVLAFDWNASGLTTILTAALKESIRGFENDLGLFICGGKGKTSRRTPEEIANWGYKLSMPDGQTNRLIYNSKMSAKVDSSLVQDGYSLYHHSFFFSKNGAWAVVQQGMNLEKQTARRYHWSSDNLKDLIEEPHKGIMTAVLSKDKTLNMTAKESDKNRSMSVEFVNGNFNALMKDIQILRKHSSSLSQMMKMKIDENQLTLLNLEDTEFTTHPVVNENFSQSKYLEKILWLLCERQPENYETLLQQKGVGAKTIRALSLVSEVIYGAEASYTDPARYSFAHGGKDSTPYPVDKKTYDQSIDILKRAVEKSHISLTEKKGAIERLANLS